MEGKTHLEGVIRADIAETVIEGIIGRRLTNAEWLQLASSIEWKYIIANPKN